MSPSRIGRSVRLLAVGSALVIGLALPGAVSADTTGGVPTIQPAGARDATIKVNSVAVTAKVIATVTITYTCQPFQTYDWQTGETTETTVGHFEGGGATVIQAQGRTIDWGQIEFFGGEATCDGTTINTASAPVTAQVSPWKVGTAVVGATIYLCDVNCSDSASASSGPVTVRLANR